MRSRGAGIALLLAVLVLASTAPAGAADKPRPVRYHDGTILTLDPRSGSTRWVTKPKRGEYLELGTVGRSMVVATSGRCGSDGLESVHTIGLDPRTGEQRWRSRVQGGVAVAGTGSHRVIVVSNGAVVALDARTGRRRWTLPTFGLIGATGTSVFADATRGSPDARVVAYDRRDGARRWQFELPSEPGGAVALVAADAKIVVVARGGFNVSYGSTPGIGVPGAPTTLFTLDARTGRERHRMIVANPDLSFSRGVLRDGMLALIDGTELSGIDLAAEAVRWHHPIAPRPGEQPGSMTLGPLGSLTGAGRGRVSIYSDRNRRAVVALETKTGRQLWSRSNLAMIDSGPAASVVLLAPLRTFVLEPVEAVDVMTGKTRWTRTLRSTYAVPSPVLSSRRIAPMSVACGTP